jgi:hypothetical protein
MLREAGFTTIEAAHIDADSLNRYLIARKD